MMRGYAEAAGCRREYIMNNCGAVYDPGDCRLCDNSRAAALALVRERNLIEWCDAV